ncbi:MAG: hypothetical protein SGCHY_005333 [Lobulomycetales sp.]
MADWRSSAAEVRTGAPKDVDCGVILYPGHKPSIRADETLSGLSDLSSFRFLNPTWCMDGVHPSKRKDYDNGKSIAETEGPNVPQVIKNVPLRIRVNGREIPREEADHPWAVGDEAVPDQALWGGMLYHF